MKAVVDSESRTGEAVVHRERAGKRSVDVYFSADVETDGPIPGPFSMLSFALVYAGRFDGKQFERSMNHATSFYRELQPISSTYDRDALLVNGVDRDRLCREGAEPREAMNEAFDWIDGIAGDCKPVLVAYPLSFDWAWLYWYFIRFCERGSPFNHSQCFDIKTAFALKARVPIADAGRSRIPPSLKSFHPHTHNALDDAVEQAEIFANLFEWNGNE